MMRPAEVWAYEINVRDEYRDDIALSRCVECIQSDAFAATWAAAIDAAAGVCRAYSDAVIRRPPTHYDSGEYESGKESSADALEQEILAMKPPGKETT